MNNKIELKKELFALCENYVDEKIKAAQKAIDTAQKSANKETKSSSGDKYETGRSMMQLEIEKYSAQLNDGLNLKKTLTQINIAKKFDTVQSGSLVITNEGNYFIAVSAGKFILDNTTYFAISYSSPVGQALFNKKVNDFIEFRDKKFIIKDIV